MPPSRTREVLRFVLYASPLVVLGIVGMTVYDHFTEKDRVIAEQKRIIAKLEKNLELAWADELVADLRVDAVEKDPPRMRLTFIQYRPGKEDEEIFRKELVLPGEEVYIDALVVQFERKFVEAGDGLRGKSMLLFRRAFGDHQEPRQGVPLFNVDPKSPVPEMARVDEAPSEFERKLWADFWEYANDPKRAAEHGIRIAQGEAPHVKVVPNQVYKLTLRTSGGLQITPRLPAATVR